MKSAAASARGGPWKGLRSGGAGARAAGARSDLHEGDCGGVDDLEQLHERGAIIRDRDLPRLVVDQLVHAPRPKRRAHDVDDGLAGVDVGDELALTLGGVRALLEQNDLRLKHRVRGHLHG